MDPPGGHWKPLDVFLFALADGRVATGIGRPRAGSGFWRPDESALADLLGGYAVDALVEQVAHGRIGVTEDAVQARALFVHLLRLVGELDEILAVDVVRVVARVEVLAAGRIEDETIGTDRFNGLTLATVPVRVAELFVRVFAVLLVGAFEVPGQRRDGQRADDQRSEELHGVRRLREVPPC